MGYSISFVSFNSIFHWMFSIFVLFKFNLFHFVLYNFICYMTWTNSLFYIQNRDVAVKAFIYDRLYFNSVDEIIDKILYYFFCSLNKSSLFPTNPAWFLNFRRNFDATHTHIFASKSTLSSKNYRPSSSEHSRQELRHTYHFPSMPISYHFFEFCI